MLKNGVIYTCETSLTVALVVKINGFQRQMCPVSHGLRDLFITLL